MSLWNDSLLVGVDKIDEQHKKLVAAIDDLLDACEKGQGKSRVGEIIAFITAYAQEHFKDEEEVQEQYGYPNLEAHKKMHQQFVHIASKFESDFQVTGPTVWLSENIRKTLLSWLAMHISNEDKKIGDYIIIQKALNK